jgi:hypothetical protein
MTLLRFQRPVKGPAEQQRHVAPQGGAYGTFRSTCPAMKALD